MQWQQLIFVEIGGDDHGNGALSTALCLLANGRNATITFTMALDRLVDGRDATPASTTALGLPANGSEMSEEGDAVEAGSVGNEEAHVFNGATEDSILQSRCDVG